MTDRANFEPVRGYAVTTCVVGRKYKLVRAGVLPDEERRDQAQLGLVAVLVAEYDA